ncbi:MAG: aminomethyltransferase beta-barrel domain-containing protein, partial [Clostridia bacterium]|nr:aminomethyltransferase beta-barrel domain-containing protein [Clostridia bacterium]
LWSDTIEVAGLNLINGVIPKSDYLYVKIRYSTVSERVAGIRETDEGLVIKTLKPLRAVTPGQSAVIYNDRIVVGGGIII